MDIVRIAILSPNDRCCGFLDNEAQNGLHYYDDELHEYLQGAASTFSCKVRADTEEVKHLVVGNKLAFEYNKKHYYLNIVKTEQDELELKLDAYSMSFELLNEQSAPYKAGEAKTFEQYLEVFDSERTLEIGINEVSQKSITNEWTGSSTILARLFSLANVFGGEVEFVPELNKDYSLKKTVINVYRENSDADQGIGKDRTDITLRYGKNVAGVVKKASITDLYTSIRPTGKDGLMVYGLDKTERDKNGNIEYHSPAGDGCIRAVQARDRFPSNLMSQSDRYITVDWSYETDDVNTLYGHALAELKKNCVPQMEYEVDGYFDTGIGDTVVIADEEYTPPLYIQARVSEQVRSFTDPIRNKTIFSNFKELESQIDPALIEKMNQLVAENKTYTCMISSDNGIVFKNGEGSTTLTASVMEGGKDVTKDCVIKWYRDGTSVFTGQRFSIIGSDIQDKAVFRFDAEIGTKVKGTYEITVSNVDDGAQGMDGVGIKSTTITYQVSTSGTTQPAGDWLDTIPVVPPGQYLWTRTVTSYTDDTSSIGFGISRNGADGQNGPQGSQGPPTGIVVSNTMPTTVYAGMLWKNTGNISGLTQFATYRWSGSAWELFTLSAKNIEAENLSAISANLGTVSAGTINGCVINGSSINGGGIYGNGSIELQKPHTVDGVSGYQRWVLINENGITIRQFSPTTTLRGQLVINESDIYGDGLSGGGVISSIKNLSSKMNELFTNVVTKGRVTVKSTSNTWLNVVGIPGYNSANRYFVLVNCNSTPLSAFARSDGRLIAYGPTVTNGTSYAVDYMVLLS